MLHHVLVMSFLHVEDGFRGVVPLNPKINIILVVSGLPELLVGYHVGVEAGDIGNISQLEELLACWCVNVDLNLAVAFHIGTAIACENRINPIWLLKGVLVETIDVIADVNRGTAVQNEAVS